MKPRDLDEELDDWDELDDEASDLADDAEAGRLPLTPSPAGGVIAARLARGRPSSSCSTAAMRARRAAMNASTVGCRRASGRHTS